MHDRPARPLAVLLLASAAVAPFALHAADAPHAAAFFRDAAIADVEAAIDLIERNHPGAAPELGDAPFLHRLSDAGALARERAPRVRTAAGHQAVLSAFTNALADKHLSFRPALAVARPEWVGLILALRDGEWIVVDEDPWPGRAPLRGARLAGCDGRSADAVAEERLGGFRAEWTIAAQRGLAAPWLLIDEGNPFLQPLAQCAFETAEGPRTIDMDWTPVARDAVVGRLRAASGIGAAGYGVRRTGDGWWVSINQFAEQAPAVVEQARARRDALRAAPFVVFDVRGNGGGASDLGLQLARILHGDDVYRDASAAAGHECPAAWRVSEANLARLASYPALLGDRLGPEANASIAADIEAMRAAHRAGAAFSRPLAACPAPAVRPRRGGPRVLLLTDRVCFSSCLLVVKAFRELGALHIGEATDGNTRYTENRREPLPSGLGSIGIQAAVALSMPARVGPFAPDVAYHGDLTDTAAVERWVLANAEAWRTLPAR